MAVYFDPVNVTGDKNMLPPSVRTSTELGNVAALSEAAVISYFTGNPPYYLYTTFLQYARTGVGTTGALGMLQYVERGLGEDISATGMPSGATIANLRVFLKGYKADSSDPNVDPNLKAALKRTIAEVTRWWLAGWGREPAVRNSSDFQAKVRAYAANADDSFPPGWDKWLTPYDSRMMPWGL